MGRITMVQDPATQDPAQPVIPIVVPVDPARDQVGHGRVLPLVGGQRPTVFDAVFNNGTQRVYADTYPGVLSAIIPGYGDLVDALAAATARVNPADPQTATGSARDAVQAALVACFTARYDHATALRVQLQQQENARARTDGDWDNLDDEEREQCEAGAAGQVPVGVLYEVPMEDVDGTSVIVDQGYWETAAVKLVINRGDYGLFDPEFTSEPIPGLAVTDEETGDEYVPATRWPANMIILDPTEEELYVESLSEAGVVTVTVRPVDLPDDTYLEALRVGREIVAARQALEPPTHSTEPPPD